MSVTVIPPEPPVSEDKKPSAFLSFVQRNPFATLWNAALIVSAVIFTRYFVEIRFIPDFNLSTSLGLVAIVALVGTIVTLALAIALLFPGLSIGWILKIWIDPEEATEGKTRQPKKTIWLPEKIPQRGACAEKIIRRFSMYFFTTYIFALLVVGFLKNYYLFWFTPSVPLVILIGRNLIKNKPGTKEFWRQAKYDLIFAVLSFLWLVLAATPLLIVIHFFSGTSWISHYGTRGGDAFIVSFVLSINFFIAMLIVKIEGEPWPRIVGLLLAVALGFLSIVLSYSNDPWFISNTVVNRLTLGNIKSINVTATAAGCQALRFNGVSVLPSGKTACEAKGLQLLSRIGTQFLLKKADAGELAPKNVVAKKKGADQPAQKKSTGKKAGADNPAPPESGVNKTDRGKSQKSGAKNPGAGNEPFTLKKADVLSWSIIDPAPIFTAPSQHRHHGKSNSAHENSH